MKLRTKFRNIAAAGAIALAGLMPFSGNAAEPTAPAPKLHYSVRTKGEVTTDTRDSTLYKETFAFGTDEKGENLKIWNIHGNSLPGDLEGPEYTATAITLPELNLSKEVSQNLIFYNNHGTQDGFAIDAVTNLKAVNTRLTFDVDTFHQLGKDASRFGGGLEYKFTDNIELGVRFDDVNVRQGMETQNFLVYGVANPTKNTELGIGIRNSKNALSETKSVAGYFSNFGKNQVGTRNWVRYDWNDKTQTDTFTFESIVAENSTFCPGRFGSGHWIISAEDTDNFDSGLLDRPMCERVSLGDRSTGGIVFDTYGSITKTRNPDTETGNFNTDIGYRFNPTKGLAITPIAGYSQNWTDQSRDHFASGSLLVQIGKSITIEGGVKQPVSGSNNLKNPVVYGLVQYTWGF